MSSRRDNENHTRRRERRPERNGKEITERRENIAPEEIASRDKIIVGGERIRGRSRRRDEGRVLQEVIPSVPRDAISRTRLERKDLESKTNAAETPRLRRNSVDRTRRIRAGTQDTPHSERLQRHGFDFATRRPRKNSARSRTTETTLMESESGTSNDLQVEAARFLDFVEAAAVLKIGSLFYDETAEKKSTDIDMHDNVALHSIIMQASTDAESFPILKSEKYLEQKKRLVKITNKFESLQNKLSLELKVKDATQNILKFSDHDDLQAKNQLLLSESKVNEISKELWVSVVDLIQAERTVMKHIGGSLRWKVEEFSQSISNAPTLRLNRSEEETKRKLISSEDRVRELEVQVQVLKSTITRLELSQEPLRELASEAERKIREAKLERERIENATSNAAPSTSEFNKIKLDYATTRVELSDTKEELVALRDSQARLRLQLEEDQDLLQSKDRQISNLLSELEEATNKIEICRGGGRITDDMINGNTSLSRMMGRKKAAQKVSSIDSESVGNVLASQLKEAVIEREKMKLKLDHEVEKVKIMERRLNSDIAAEYDNTDRQKITPRGDNREQRRLAALQSKIEELLQYPHSSYSISTLTDLVTEVIRICREKMPDSDVENLRNEIAEADLRAMDLQSIIKTQEEKLKSLISVQDVAKIELEKANMSFETDITNLRKEYELQIFELKGRHEAEFEEYKAQLKKIREDEIENAKSDWEMNLNFEFEQKMNFLKQQNDEEMKKAHELAEQEKMALKCHFEEEQRQFQTRLEASEQSLVDSKKQFFSQREKMQERIEFLEDDLKKLQIEVQSSAQDYTNRKNDLQAKIDRLYEEVDKLTSNVQGANIQLEAKSRELLDIRGVHDSNVKKICDEFQAQILELESNILQLQNSEKALRKAAADEEERGKKLQQELLRIKEESNEIKSKAARDINSAQESLFDATDQLERNQKLLRDINSDVDRYRKIAEERDAEVLALKRLLRSKEKELTDGVMTGSTESSSVRKILEQKDKEIKSVRSELRSTQGELSTLKRKLEVKDREIDEAKKAMKRAANGDKDEKTDEIARLQIMLLDLKTTRVDLLEKLDDSEHEVEMLKKEISVLKGIAKVN